MNNQIENENKGFEEATLTGELETPKHPNALIPKY